MSHPRAAEAFVVLSLPDGGEVTLVPGDLIGRLSRAELHINDIRVSEAHALLSLRGHQLRLLALRGALFVGRQPLTDLALREDLSFELVPGLALRVVRLGLPPGVFALKVGGGAPRVLERGRASLLAGSLRVVEEHAPEARAWVWSTGEGWFFQPAGGSPTPIAPGWSAELDGVRISAEELRHDGVSSTVRDAEGPLRLLARYESVRFSRAGFPDVVLGGVPARILSELLLFGQPVHWLEVAGELWKDEADEARLRMRWDRNLKRMRFKLRSGGIEREMLRSLGNGMVELELRPGDEVLNEA